MSISPVRFGQIHIDESSLALALPVERTAGMIDELHTAALANQWQEVQQDKAGLDIFIRGEIEGFNPESQGIAREEMERLPEDLRAQLNKLFEKGVLQSIVAEFRDKQGELLDEVYFMEPQNGSEVVTGALQQGWNLIQVEQASLHRFSKDAPE